MKLTREQWLAGLKPGDEVQMGQLGASVIFVSHLGRNRVLVVDKSPNAPVRARLASALIQPCPLMAQPGVRYVYKHPSWNPSWTRHYAVGTVDGRLLLLGTSKPTFEDFSETWEAQKDPKEA